MNDWFMLTGVPMVMSPDDIMKIVFPQYIDLLKTGLWEIW